MRRCSEGFKLGRVLAEDVVHESQRNVERKVCNLMLVYLFPIRYTFTSQTINIIGNSQPTSL